MIVRRGMGAGSPAITSLITSIAGSEGVNPALALAVAQHESGFNPNAFNPGGGGAGAAGLFQLRSAAQQQYGVTNPYDPTQNATGGISYLRDMLAKYNGDQNLALMAYACGPGNVDKFLSTGSWPSICDTSYPAAISAIEGSAAPGSSLFVPPSLDTSTTDTGSTAGVDLSMLGGDSSGWMWAAAIGAAILLAMVME